MFYNNNMKKFALLTVMGLCLGFTACDDYEEPNPAAQKNEQEAIFEAGGVTVTPQSAQQNLIEIAAASADVPVLTVEAANVPNGYSIEMVMEISKDDSFANAVVVATTNVDGVIYASAKAVNDAYKEVITKDPAAGVAKVRDAGYVVNEKNRVRIGDADTFYGAYDLSIVPFAAEKEIETTYVLQSSKDGATWKDVATFNHSSASPYDDPAFSLAVNFTDDMFGDEGMYWQVKSGKGKVFGVSEEEVYNDNGSLVEGGQAAISFLAGPVLFSINMWDLTFNYIQAIEQFWTPGQSNGWGFGENCQTLVTEDYTHYYGYVNLDSMFKLSPNPAWSGDFGSDGGVTFVEENGVLVGTGIATGSANINIPEPGLYYVELNYGTKELKLTQIKTLGLIGGFNAWGESVAMTPSEDFLTWKGSFSAGENEEFKIRANNGWDINLGGTFDNLVPGGNNLTTGSDGNFTITLHLAQHPYYVDVEVVK